MLIFRHKSDIRNIFISRRCSFLRCRTPAEYNGLNGSIDSEDDESTYDGTYDAAVVDAPLLRSVGVACCRIMSKFH